MAFTVFLKYLSYCSLKRICLQQAKKECQEIVQLLKIALHQGVLRVLSESMNFMEWGAGVIPRLSSSKLSETLAIISKLKRVDEVRNSK